MKRIVLVFAVLTLAFSVFADAFSSWSKLPEGGLYWKMDTTYGNSNLCFLADTLWGYVDPNDIYFIPDYAQGSDAPWYPYRDIIRNVSCWQADTIGKRAFSDLKNLYYLIMPDEASLKDSVFWGCTNLRVVEVRDAVPHAICPTSFKTSDTKAVEMVLVDENAVDLFRKAPIWKNYPISPSNGIWNNIWWQALQSDSLSSLRLQLSNACCIMEGKDTAISIPDMAAGEAPWSTLGNVVQDLKVEGRFTYVGRNAFSGMHQLDAIVFLQSQTPVDSIHYDAFEHDIHPWKFAWDGDFMPCVNYSAPKVIDMQAEPTNFANTVVYVPDSTFSDSTKSVDNYAAAPFWKSFGVITDHCVSIKNLMYDGATLSWYSVEHSDSYVLTLILGDDTLKSVTIPALGGKGLVDWTHVTIPTCKPIARMPMDGGGGATITINITLNSGTSAAKSIDIAVNGLESETEYSYMMEARANGWAQVSKSGSFKTPIKKTSTDLVSGITDADNSDIYDLQGRHMGHDLWSLPDGIYIVRKGSQTEKHLILHR